MTDAGTRFVELHAEAKLFVMPNPWDVGTARILASLGYTALATSSAALANLLGRPDGEGAVSRAEAIAQARTIVEATALPVNGDLENGYGNSPEAVATTVAEAGAVGRAGCSIEDATGRADDPIYAHAHAVERIAAAVEAARGLGRPFVLTARAENLLHGRHDLDDTIRRLQAFEKAGADVLYAPGLTEIGQVRTVLASVTRPLNVLIGMRSVRFTVAELAAAGVRRASLGSGLFRTAQGAFLHAARELATDGTLGFLGGAVTSGEVDPLIAGSRVRPS